MYNKVTVINYIQGLVLRKSVTLPNDIQGCHDMIALLFMQIEEMAKNLRLANHRLYGQSSEQSKYIGDLVKSKMEAIRNSEGMIQLNLFTDIIEDIKKFDAEAQAAHDAESKKDDEEKEEKSKSKPKNKDKKCYKGRKKRIADLENLRTVECHHGEDISCCPSCTGDNIKEMGSEEVSEIEIIPAEIIVKKHIIHKVICNDCKKITRGDKPVAPLPGCMAGPALLTHICHSRFDLYVPYYRLNRDFKTYGVDISISNLCNWMNHLSEDIFFILYEALKRNVLSAKLLYADETVLKELAKGKCKQKYIWEYINIFSKNVVFEYADRAGENCTEFLKDYKDGFLITDKYSGYDAVTKKNNLTRAYCWDHGRRKFHEIIKSSKDPEELTDVKYIFNLINEMLHTDKEIRKGPIEQVLDRRQKDVAPKIDFIYEKLEVLKSKIIFLKGSLILAINYLLDNPVEFRTFLLNPYIEPTNNISERTFRFLALGRKNWLFAGSARGGKTTAVISSIIASARMNDLDIRKYILHIITNMPNAKQSEIDSFLPQNCPQFKSTRKLEE